MCSYCIVPFTRGKERSRPIASILEEVQALANNGIRDVTLLGTHKKKFKPYIKYKAVKTIGQNVNSYRDVTSNGNHSSSTTTTSLVPGFRTVYKAKQGGARFDQLLKEVAEKTPSVRIRFTSPHPKDFPDDVLHVMQAYPNICKHIHLPAQSGNSAVLERMRRGYTREAYLGLVERIRCILPDVALSSDFICGFCGETEREFEDTLSLFDACRYNVAFMFAYSMREVIYIFFLYFNGFFY